MSMLTFNSIDVETANTNRASICQIGVAHVRNGQIKDEWKTLVNPEDYFHQGNVFIHGIRESDVRYGPTLPEVCNELRARLRGAVLVSHTPFDRTAFEQAMGKYGLEQLQVTWLDSARIAAEPGHSVTGKMVTALRVLPAIWASHFSITTRLKTLGRPQKSCFAPALQQGGILRTGCVVYKSLTRSCGGFGAWYAASQDCAERLGLRL